MAIDNNDVAIRQLRQIGLPFPLRGCRRDRHFGKRRPTRRAKGCQKDIAVKVGLPAVIGHCEPARIQRNDLRFQPCKTKGPFDREFPANKRTAAIKHLTTQEVV